MSKKNFKQPLMSKKAKQFFGSQSNYNGGVISARGNVTSQHSMQDNDATHAYWSPDKKTAGAAGLKHLHQDSSTSSINML